MQSDDLAEEAPPDHALASVFSHRARLIERYRAATAFRANLVLVSTLVGPIAMIALVLEAKWFSFILLAGVMLYATRYCIRLSQAQKDLADILSTQRDSAHHQALFHICTELLLWGVSGIKKAEVVKCDDLSGVIRFKLDLGAIGQRGIIMEAVCRFVWKRPLPLMAKRRCPDEVSFFIDGQQLARKKVVGLCAWIVPTRN